jgi:fructose-1,6-bisphosphatase I
MSSDKNFEKFVLPMGTTLDRFIMRNQAHFPYATGELSQLLRDIALASKIVNREINRAGLINIAGSYGANNTHGEEQQKLDVVANVRFSRALAKGGEACAIISEEDEEMVITGNNHSKYVVAIDPLDGSSNIDVNVAIGTIFSIYRRRTPVNTEPTLEDVLQAGRWQVAAGYILYGSSTMLVLTTGKGVHGFTYEPSLGEYYLSHPDMRMPENGTVYSANEGLFLDFEPSVQRYLEYCKTKRYSARYIGSFVGDFHRNLLKGGIFLYPSTAKYPSGKLRIMYECNPLAFLVEQAGGRATTGTERVLEIQPTSLHQRIPLFIGSRQMVDHMLQYMAVEAPMRH